MTRKEAPIISLATLSPNKQLAFALLVFERMLPSLTAFARDTGFDDSCYLRGRETAWASLQSGSVDPASSQECYKNAPDTEDFTHELTSHALNAALAMSDILEFAADKRPDHIADVLTLVSDSLHLYVSSAGPSVASSPEGTHRIASHPLTQQEHHQEQEDLKFIARLPDLFDKNAISILRARASVQAPLLG